MLWNCKTFIVIVILFEFVTGFYSSFWLRNKSNDTDIKLKRLLACLASTGVNINNIYVRDSGPKYTELNWQWDTMNGYIKPLVYLVATDVGDIQKAVICAQRVKVRIVPRSGGHSYTKYGFGDSESLIVDLASMNDIQCNVEQKTCDIEAGARNGLISYKLWEKSFLMPQGICPTVGIGGLALGGGYGHFARLYGLVTDSIVEMEMVDAKGQLIVINSQINNDLFWALRGGGGGTFGIVSKFTFRVHHSPKSIISGIYRYSFKDFKEFYTAWQGLISSTLPNNVFCILEMENDWIEMELYGVNGDHLEEMTVRKIENYQYLFHFPLATNSSTKLMKHDEFLISRAQPYSNVKLTKVSQLADMVRHNHVGWKKVKSIYVNKILNEVQIDKLNELLADYLKVAGFSVEYYGGAIDNYSPTATAFIHRGKNLFLIQLRPWYSQGPKVNKQAENAMKTFFERSKSIYDHKESYQNYLDEDIPDFLTRYYGENLQRLIAIKKRIDPDNVFHHPQSIPPQYWKISD